MSDDILKSKSLRPDKKPVLVVTLYKYDDGVLSIGCDRDADIESGAVYDLIDEAHRRTKPGREKVKLAMSIARKQASSRNN